MTTSYHLVVELKGISKTLGSWFLILVVEMNPSQNLRMAMSEAFPSIVSFSAFWRLSWIMLSGL